MTQKSLITDKQGHLILPAYKEFFKYFFNSNNIRTIDDLKEEIHGPLQDSQVIYELDCIRYSISSVTGQSWLSNEEIDKLAMSVNLAVWKDHQPEGLEIGSKYSDDCINKKYEFNVTANEKKLMMGAAMYEFYNEKAKDCDACDLYVRNHPVRYLGCSACDAFFKEEIGCVSSNFLFPSIETIAKFMKRYPKNKIECVVNTTSFSSGDSGQHWVVLVFHNSTCHYICSCATDITALKCWEKICEELRNNGIELISNSKPVQHDQYNCGLYSLATILITMCFPIEEAQEIEQNYDPNKNRA